MQQRGNVLFLILIAVALFAALAFAVTSSTRSTGKNATKETLQTQVASMLQYFATLDNAILRMRISENIPLESLSFNSLLKRYDGSSVNYHINPNCTTDACKVFHPTGGGVALVNFPNYGVETPTNIQPNYPAPGSFVLAVMKFPHAGTDANDVVMNIKYLKPEFCDELNKTLNITGTIGVTGSEIYAFNPSVWDSAGYTISTNADQLMGKTTFAATYSGTGTGKTCGVFHLVVER